MLDNLSPYPPHPQAGDPRHLKVAYSYLGLSELTGNQANERVIVQMFKDVGHGWVRTDEVSWCSAFVGACLKEAGRPYLKSLAARAYTSWGKPTKSPKRGDVVVFWRITPSDWRGHVGFFLSETGGGIKIIGGNQNNKVSIRSYPKSRLLGYRTAVDLRPVVGNSRTTTSQVGVGTGVAVVSGGEVLRQTVATWEPGDAQPTFGVEQTIAVPLQETGGLLMQIAWVVPWLTAIGVGLILLGTGVTLYSRWDDWKQKGR